MTAFVVVLVLLVPSGQGGQPLEAELYREVIGVSSLAACERHAERLAQARRSAMAEHLARTGGRIRGECRAIEPRAST